MAGENAQTHTQDADGAPATNDAASAPRVVLLVGGSSGIGQAAARQLAERGDTVVLMARSPEALKKAAETLPGEVMLTPADVLDEDAVRDAVERIRERYGRLDAVVHSGQPATFGRIEDVPREVFEHTVNIGVHGTANLARVLLPVFRAQGHGTFVIVNSVLGEIATPYMGGYDVAKWGQLGLARILQLEVRDAPGVDVCIVSPGAVDTPIYDQGANYTGREVHPPPPVTSADRVARTIVGCLDRPRRHVEVPLTNHIMRLGFLLFPSLYDRLVGPMVRALVLRGGPRDPSPGNVLDAVPDLEGPDAGWSFTGGRSR